MRARAKARHVYILAAASCWAGGVACSAPLRVHEPIEYPQTKLECSAIELQVTDPRLSAPSVSAPGARQLDWPESFEAAAQSHLAALVLGQGPALIIAGRVGAADELEIVDARGEMTRVSVALHFDVNVKDGPLVRRAEAHSSYDLPRDEAAPDELQVVLGATALDAFDRYWANPTTLSGLNRELAAYAKRHAEAQQPDAAGQPGRGGPVSTPSGE